MSFDSLEFRLIDPVYNEEWWSVRGGCHTRDMALEVYVNGRDLRDVIYESEADFKAERGLKGKRCEYGHITPSAFFNTCMEAAFSSGEGKDITASLLCDFRNGNVPSVTFHVSVEGDAVYWSHFNRPYGNWDYPLKYCFEIDAYKRAFEQLKAFTGCRREGYLKKTIDEKIDEVRFNGFYDPLLTRLRPYRDEFVILELGGQLFSDTGIEYIQTLKNTDNETWLIECAVKNKNHTKIFAVKEATPIQLLRIFRQVLVTGCRPKEAHWEDITNDVTMITEGNVGELLWDIWDNAQNAFIDAMADAQSEFLAGRKLAYYEVLETIRKKFEDLGIDLSRFSLDFNVEKFGS